MLKLIWIIYPVNVTTKNGFKASSRCSTPTRCAKSKTKNAMIGRLRFKRNAKRSSVLRDRWIGRSKNDSYKNFILLENRPRLVADRNITNKRSSQRSSRSTRPTSHGPSYTYAMKL